MPSRPSAEAAAVYDWMSEERRADDEIERYADRSAKIAATHDWIEDRRQADLARERDTARTEALLELSRLGVTQTLARLIYDMDRTRPCGPTLEDHAEAAALEYLVATFGVDRRNKREMDLARKQASYARKLTINMGFLESNLKRNLRRKRKRLDRQQKEYRARKRRPHKCLGTLTQRQRLEAERLWASGANHGLSWFQAMQTRPKENGAVYQRVRRILTLVTKMSTRVDI